MLASSGQKGKAIHSPRDKQGGATYKQPRPGALTLQDMHMGSRRAAIAALTAAELDDAIRDAVEARSRVTPRPPNERG